MEKKTRLAILGSTGSIGTQTLEVIRNYPDKFEIDILTANQNIDLLASQALEFNPNIVVICNAGKKDALENLLRDADIKVMGGIEPLNEVVARDSVDMVLSALVGYSGLMPTLKAIEAGKDIALANKETLVVAGELIIQMAEKHQVKITPVDSEHSAIFQCLAGENYETIEKIYLTASGGPFRQKKEDQLNNVTVTDALKHPNWNMGHKITIDSATMMNKGFEVIEAKWLFHLEPRQIDVVIHPQSIIHSLVQFVDGSMKAQMGLPDMKLPILYALSGNRRLKTSFERFNFIDYPELTFEKPDDKKFRNLYLAYYAMEKGGNMPCTLNAANEVAVNAFLKEEVTFLQIADLIEQSIHQIPYIAKPNLEDYIKTDNETRDFTEKLIKK
ncbi:MAG TPA: 1-deoxy-D-xylulose-5-phosphate reductoisomerase [bacterium]|nr:1-deoxy-D-xylulose-5-phosphate reductoisomerase [bacterium]